MLREVEFGFEPVLLALRGRLVAVGNGLAACEPVVSFGGRERRGERADQLARLGEVAGDPLSARATAFSAARQRFRAMVSGSMKVFLLEPAGE